MSNSYTVKLPDGNEYGPVDLPTLRSWHEEGRIGPDTWVWPDGSPEWLTLMDVLAGAGQTSEAEVEMPIRMKPSDTDPRGLGVALSQAAQTGEAAVAAVPTGPQARPRTPARAAEPGVVSPWALVTGRYRRVAIGVAATLGVALVALLFWMPRWQRQQAGRRAEAEASGERRFSEEALGLALDAPPGWVLLRPDSTLLVAPQARVKLAHPALGAFAVLTVEALPPGLLSLDAFLDRVVDGRRGLLSAYRDVGRSDTTLGRLRARRLQAAWVEEGSEQRATILATQDAWSYAALAAWGPASSAAKLTPEIDALLRAVSLSGSLAAKVKEAADTLEPETPDLSRNSLELLLRDRLGNGEAPESVPDAAVYRVSRGLAALSRDETQELQQILAQVYDPMSEAVRQRLAGYQREARAGRKVAQDEAQALHQILHDGLMTLPEEARKRLQALNEKAIAASYAIP